LHHSLHALVWLSSYVAIHPLAFLSQSGEKDLFHCTVYNITLDYNCEAQKVSKKTKNMQKIGSEAKINAWVI
jgi:hypothetical protein